MSRQLLTPDRNCDIHMGGYDFACAECHKTRNHQISGKSSSVPVAEGVVNCESCHSETPHYSGNLLDHHLNDHSKTLACNVCHARCLPGCKPTKTWWDWSQAGDKEREVKKDKYGQPDYDWKKGIQVGGVRTAGLHLVLGYMDRVLMGDKVDLDADVITD